MLLPSAGGQTFQTTETQGSLPPAPHAYLDGQFNIFEWCESLKSCLGYFLDHGQYTKPVQAIAAVVNIKLPFQGVHSPDQGGQPLAQPVLIPYIRRLVATGYDYPDILHGFFGGTWKAGIGPLHDMERRNYLFAAKSVHWLEVKGYYDMDEGQYIPFLRPLQNVSEAEIINAEISWGRWLAMQDWMVGPRLPVELET